MAGLLDIPGFDPAEFQVSDEERKKLLIGNILLGISAGAFNSNKGNQLGALGSGLLQGAMMGQRALSDAQAAKLDKLKAASGFMDFAGKKQAYLDDQAARAAEQAYQPSGLPTTGDLSPRPENLARLQQKQTLYEQLMAKADYFDAQKLPRKAKEYRDEAMKLAPKYKGLETVMQDGKPVVLQTFENQAPTPTQYQPKPDYKSVDTGGNVGFYDPLSGQWGGQFGKTLTPGEAQSGQLGWANYGLAQNADARAASNQGAPAIVDGQYVDKFGGGARPIPNFQKPPKELTESQGQASMYLGMMQSASQDIAKLKDPPSSSALAVARGEVPVVPQAVQNWVASSDAQKYAQSSLQWTEAMLRITTGATAPPEEVVRTSKTFFPQVGDSEAVKKQKEEKRRQMEKFVRIKAGGGAEKVDSLMSGGWSITPVQ